MPVWDLVASARALVRYAIVVAVILYITGSVVLVINIVTSTWQLFATSIYDFNIALNQGGGGSVMSCVYFFAHGLGVDIIIRAFFASAMGLAIFWASAIANIMIIQFTLSIKNVLLKGA